MEIWKRQKMKEKWKNETWHPHMKAVCLVLYSYKGHLDMWVALIPILAKQTIVPPAVHIINRQWRGVRVFREDPGMLR